VLLVLLAPSRPRAAVRVEVEPGTVVALAEGQEIYVEAAPRKSEGLLAFSRRLCDDEAAAGEIAAANGGLERGLHAGVRYRVPYRLLRSELMVTAARTLFADDQPHAEGWRHRVRGYGELSRENLWRVSEWFTGQGQNFRAIRAHNRLVEEELIAGQTVVIPRELLLPAFRALLPPPSQTPPSQTSLNQTPSSQTLPNPKQQRAALPVLPSSAQETGTTGGVEGDDGAVATAARSLAAGFGARYELDYGRDGDGEYAVYRLRPGEALYSSVVVRFTGRLLAEDVNALAREVAARSGIRDVTDIPVGYAVKIPFELLMPEHLPQGHPRRSEYEAALAATAQFGNQVRALDLAGVTVILDAGHGGADSGASFAGVWESLYVYDVMLRVKYLLENYTAATVLPTVRDGERVLPEDRDVLSFSRNHRVLTTPPYRIEQAAIGTNLRWYLANSMFRASTKNGLDEKRMVFLSLHADSLHPSLRGAMVYVPDAGLRAGTYSRTGAVYASRKEYKEAPSVSFSHKSRVESEGLSRDLADDILRAFGRRGLEVHPDKPIREKIIRRRQQYVPAVLRYNAVPAKVLIELCNLSNDQDRRLLQTRAHRQKMAEAIVEGLLGYYGVDQRQVETLHVAEAAR
jgi:N-acetylmuramoyl-L-alanine amidase